MRGSDSEMLLIAYDTDTSAILAKQLAARYGDAALRAACPPAADIPYDAAICLTWPHAGWALRRTQGPRILLLTHDAPEAARGLADLWVAPDEAAITALRQTVPCDHLRPFLAVPDLAAWDTALDVARQLAETRRPMPTQMTPAPAAQIPSDRIEVSVISGTYQRLDSLRRMVASVRRELAGERYEIVLADGGSTDGTREWIEQQPDCRMVDGGLTGAIDAHNIAYRASSGQNILSVNDENALCDGAGAAALAHLRDQPEVGQICFAFSLDRGQTYSCPEYSPGHYHPNIALTRRVAIEDVIERIGAFWGDAEHRVHRTYAGDTLQGIVLRQAGWLAVTLPEAKAIDWQGDVSDGLRQDAHTSYPADAHQLGNWGCGLAPTRPVRVEPADPCGWPAVYIPPPGRMPRRSPLLAGPPERVLALPLAHDADPQYGLRAALARIGPYAECCRIAEWYDRHRSRTDTGREILALARSHRPTLIWMQLQSPEDYGPAFLRALRAAVPEALLVLWNGDVSRGAAEPLPDWQIATSREADLTLATDCSTALRLAAAGCRAGYQQVGYDAAAVEAALFGGGTPDCPRAEDPEPWPWAIFLGTEYPSRREWAEAVGRALPGRLRIHGPRWLPVPGVEACPTLTPREAATPAYRDARLAISCSLVEDLDGYSSDRLALIGAAGGLLAVREFRGMERWGLRPDENCLVWRTTGDLLRLMRFWCDPARDALGRPLREALRALARDAWTWDASVEQLLAIVRAERHRRAVEATC